MDAIEALDEGAAAHFGFQAKQIPGILTYMEPAYYLSGFVASAVFLALILVLLWLKGKHRAAVVAVLSFAAAFALIEIARLLVPRARPQDAVNWLGPDAKVGSYPSAATFLFMLSMILLGNVLRSYFPRPWMNALFVFVAALLTGWVCVSQFFLSIHHITDVLGGIAGAALIGWIALRFGEKKVLADITLREQGPTALPAARQ